MTSDLCIDSILHINQAGRPVMSKFIYLLYLTPLLLMAQHRCEIITISERVGDTIEAYEREYFAFFPGVNEFNNAQVIIDPKTNGIMLRIQSQRLNNDYIYIDKDILKALESYIEKFEKFDWQKTMEYIALRKDQPGWEFIKNNLINWDLIEERQLMINDPIKEGALCIVNSKGKRFNGFLIEANDLSVVLFTNYTDYDWRDPIQNISQLYYSSIDSLIFFESEKIGFVTGSGIGLVVGTGIGLAIGAGMEGGMFPGLALTMGGVIGGISGILIGGAVFSVVPNGELESEPTVYDYDKDYLYLFIRKNGLVYSGPLLPLELVKILDNNQSNNYPNGN